MGFFSSRRDRRGGFTPSVMNRLLSPAISGNTINGFGESEVRPPSPLYHHKNQALAHEKLQNYFYARIVANPHYWKLFREITRLENTEHDPVAPRQTKKSPEDWSRDIKDFALANGAQLVGMVKMDPLWVFDGYPVSEKWIIVLGVAMEHDKLMRIVERGVDSIGGAHVISIYNHGTRTARRLANWIRGQGWDARGNCGPLAGPVSLIPAALAAGFGELGKHGSIINDEYGSNFRLAYVLCDLPLVADQGREINVDDFCVSCQLCTNECPTDAIYETKQQIRGVSKWYVDFDKCVPYFNDSQGCGICIAICPWSRPGVAGKLAEKMRRRREGVAGEA